MCLLGSAFNGLFMIFWVVAFVGFSTFQNWIMQYGKWILFIDMLFLILCLIIGIVIFKLDLECLFLKYEERGITQGERILFLLIFGSFVGIIAFEFAVAFFYNISSLSGVKMLSSEVMRYQEIPVLAEANLLMGAACLLAHNYYQFIQ